MIIFLVNVLRSYVFNKIKMYNQLLHVIKKDE
jgi:hypothetical protein